MNKDTRKMFIIATIYSMVAAFGISYGILSFAKAVKLSREIEETQARIKTSRLNLEKYMKELNAVMSGTSLGKERD